MPVVSLHGETKTRTVTEMTQRNSNRRGGVRVGACLFAAVVLAPVPIVIGTTTPAQAQVAVRAEFRTALASYGRWERHSRWGEVWVPTRVSREWRPYPVGHWAYT